MLVATFEADRVVGLGGALLPEVVREVVQYAVRTAHPRLWYAYGIRARGALGASCPAPLLRTAHTWLVTRLAGTYSTEAPGRTCQLRFDQAILGAAVSVLRRAVGTMPR